MSSIITLTTDFGYNDAYVAVVKGVILSTNSEANIVDITHSIEPQNIAQAAFILNTAYRHFPKQTVHLAVVDPDVGSERQGIIVKTPSAFFVAPDNGLLSHVINELSSTTSLATQHPSGYERVTFKTGVEIVAITDPRFWRHPISFTFHARDIFAPVAAGISLGISIYEFGEKINSLYVFPVLKPSFDAQGNLIGQIVYIDNFGNLITNIKNSDIPKKDVIIETAGYCIQGVSNYYAQNEGIMAILGSAGYLEIALRNGSACDFLGMIVGDEIKVVSPIE